MSEHFLWAWYDGETQLHCYIAERAREDSERLDWLTVPHDQTIIDDDTLEWLCGTSKLLEDVVPLAERQPGSSTWGEAC